MRHILTLPALIALAGCSEYSLNNDEAALSGGAPLAVVSPEAVDGVVCDLLEQEVTVRNDGDASLEVLSVWPSSEAWGLAGPDVPLTLAAGEAVAFTVSTAEEDARLGDEVLTVETNDPERPVIEIPLAAQADSPPSATITSPSSGETLGIGADTLLRGAVGDAQDPPGALSVAWISSEDGLLSEQPADAEGTAEASWRAGTRSPGPHTLWLEVEDTCGNVTRASTQVCQQDGYAQDELDVADWNFEGSARWDGDAGYLVLTEATGNQVGSAFETGTAVRGDNVEIRFLFYIGDGSGADGLSLTVLDADRMTGFLGGTGCGIGYGGDASCTAGPALPGWSIEVDTYHNSGQDPDLRRPCDVHLRRRRRRSRGVGRPPGDGGHRLARDGGRRRRAAGHRLHRRHHLPRPGPLGELRLPRLCRLHRGHRRGDQPAPHRLARGHRVHLRVAATTPASVVVVALFATDALVASVVEVTDEPLGAVIVRGAGLAVGGALVAGGQGQQQAEREESPHGRAAPTAR